MLQSAAVGCLHCGTQHSGRGLCNLQGNEAHESLGPFALLLCMAVRGPGIAWKALPGTDWFKNSFFLWGHAASSEIWQDEWSLLVSSRTSEAQFPADSCPFPPHSNLSFPFLSPPFSLITPLTHFRPLREFSSVLVVPRRTGHYGISGCSGHCVCWLAKTPWSLPCRAPGLPVQNLSSPSWRFPSNSWKLQVWDFHPVPHVIETNPKSPDKRHWQKGQQWGVINLNSAGSQAKEKHPEGQTLPWDERRWDDLQPGIPPPSKGQAVGQEELHGKLANSYCHKTILPHFNWEVLLIAAPLLPVKLGFFVQVLLW